MGATTEAYSWMEGSVYLSTGIPFLSSAGMSLVDSTDINFVIGWVNTPAAGGIYHNHVTGTRGDVTIAGAYSTDKTALRWLDSATAVHMKLLHTGVNGSAGYFLYSGRLQSVKLAGANGQVYKFNIQYYANSWSGF